jgi:DNA uptake protein ComE-like DNA-binding protein
MRIAYAKRLRKEIEKLKEGVDFILIGDFNSNYNEYKTFQNSEKLNNSGGITGINHILGTIQGTEMINEEMLTNQTEGGYLYNLWLEIRNTRRWSYNFFGKKGSPDNIIVSKGLYDGEGISYEDNSFDKFHPSYLFKKRAIYRWQKAKKGTGRHLGKGYSDHLPIFAYFSTNPFFLKTDETSSGDINPVELKKIKPPKTLLNPNTASGEELMSISGIGPVLSERIVAGRPYRTVDDLLKVKGIGPKRLKKFRPYFLIR